MAAVTALATGAWVVAPVVVDSEAALGASGDRAHAQAVVEVHPAWEASVAVAAVAVEVVLAAAAAVVVAVVVEAVVVEGDK